MSVKWKEFTSNFLYVMFGNAISMLVSVAVTFLVPNFFSPGAYSYFQLENLYCGYIWLLSLGWNDGIYLKYGGQDREKVDKRKTASGFLLLSLYLMLAGGLAGTAAYSFCRDADKKIVLILSFCSVIIEILTAYITNLLQATNSMKQYAKITILDRSCYFIFVMILLIMGVKDYRLLIGVDIFSKGITFVISAYMGRDFIFAKLLPVKMVFRGIKEVISAGLPVSLAVYAGRLINSMVQFFVEHRWGLMVFGKISLTLSISNLFTKIVAAVSVVLFPALRRTEEKKLPDMYRIMSTILITLLLGLFLLYLPARAFLSICLPGYADSLHYMAVLLPISLYETKVTMLVNTYFKAIRKEREILYCNLLTVLLSFALSGICVYVFESLDMAVFSIVLLLAFRSILEEKRLANYIAIRRSCLPELSMTAVFIGTNWYIGGIAGTICYGIAYVCYLWSSRLRIKEVCRFISKMQGSQG